MNLNFFSFKSKTRTPLHCFQEGFWSNQHILVDQVPLQIPYRYLLDKLNEDEHLEYHHM